MWVMISLFGGGEGVKDLKITRFLIPAREDARPTKKRQ